ncbi:MAG: DUF4327 family protein [Hydrococcus sp. Prado102]|jgi:uncharacterized protein YqgQ|nr:DUF4327 family protein [Hydrococcus sp. Prado102]
MTINIISTSTTRYTIEMIREEARQLVEKGIISRKQPIWRW